MEAAKPVFCFNTPKCEETCESCEQMDEKDKIMTEIKSYEITLNNNIFKLELAKSENNKNIILKAYDDKERKLKYFISYLSMKAFNNLSTFFQFYKNINEIYELLEDTLNNKKYSCFVKEKFLILILNFMMPGGKVIDVDFKLNEEKIKKEELINQLYDTVNQLTEENKLMKIEINNLKEDINNKNQKMNDLENKLDDFENELKNLKDENSQIKDKLKYIEEKVNKKSHKKEKEKDKSKNETNIENKSVNENKIKKLNKEEKIKETPGIQNIELVGNLFNESKIIKSLEEKINLNNWISSKGKINKIKLIYRATDNGDDSESFFKKCSNIGPSLSVIKAKNGRRFGGFTKAEWTDQKGKVILKDENSFLYSIDNKEKYDILKSESAISCYPYDYTLVYGNKQDRYGIRLFSRFLEKSSYENLASKVYNVPQEICLSGKNKFEVEEVEIFQIIFE